MKFFQSFLVVGALSLVFISCKKDKDDVTPTPTTPKKQIAYVYKTDATDANAFKLLLDSNNCNVTLVEKSSAAAFNFSTSDLIIVGSNTDDTQLVPNWSNAEATAIDGSGKPVLLMGIGGLQLGVKLSHKVNYGTCAGSSINSIISADATDAIYKAPKTIAAVTNQPVQLFISASGAQSFNSGGVAVPGVDLIGRESSGSNYYTVTIESNRYGVYGFTSGVSNMTKTGRDFIVNLVYRIGKF